MASIVFYCSTLGFPLASHCRKPTRSQGSKLAENYFKIFLLLIIRHFLTKFSFPSKTLGYLASIVFYCSTFGFPLASHCRNWKREANDLKLMKIISKLNIPTTEHVPLSVKIYFSLQNPWLLSFHCFLLFNLWLPIVGSQREAKDKKLMKIVSKLNIYTTEHAPLSVKI